MITYIIRRLLAALPLLIGITLISFFVIHLAPGKPVNLQESLNPKVSLEVRERLTKLYGLDRPVHVQYIDWLGRILRLDFGRSFVDDRLAVDKIAERIPLTLIINVVSLFLIFLLALPIGIRSAVRPGGLFDKAATVFVFVGFALPGFWFALLLMNLFGVQWGWLPVSGLRSLDFEYLGIGGKIWDLSRHLLLPVFVIVFGGLAGLSRYMRQNMIEALNQPYIYTARAKGLSESKVLYKHALRNALLPVVTILGMSVPGLLGGSVIFESIFALPGLGRLFFEAVMARDYPLIMAALVITSVLTLVGNLLADISYAYVDPRIRYNR
jgi:peptide/nickel transport system permease protein